MMERRNGRYMIHELKEDMQRADVTKEDAREEDFKSIRNK